MEGTMRTIAYVDGHNLYFSCLKATSYKWLDLEKLLLPIITASAPGSVLTGIKYFTAPIKASLARYGQRSTDAQAEYVRALLANPRMAVVEGRFSVGSTHALLHVVPPDRDSRVRIWRIEEKETDVSLAVSMYADARSDGVDQVILVSNDSDMVPALRAIRRDTATKIGVVLPIRQAAQDQLVGRRPSASLGTHAHWVRGHILETELAAAQLPLTVMTRRRPARRPAHW